MNNLYCYYRISDKGNPLGRTELGNTFLSSVTRRKCFNNFIDAFGYDNLTVIADNANEDTIWFIKSKGILNLIITEMGNTSSFLYVINRAIIELKPDDIVYTVEDDYLHTPDAKQYIFEGIDIGNYVSLYDSLDKYIDSNKGGNNPLITNGGEDTKVILGRTSHFKKTNATTGTFATKIKTLQEDYDIIIKHNRPEFSHPHDFLMFRELITTKNRILICPIPGKASHVGLEMSPFIDWKHIVDNLREN